MNVNAHFELVKINSDCRYFDGVFRSRTKNMMWYGVLGTKELLHRTYKNLEQRVLLEVRSHGRITL